MKIEKIEVLINAIGIDRIYLKTDMPNTFPEIKDQGNMQMTIDLQHGTAIEYMKENFQHTQFPATALIIDGKTGTKTVVVIKEYYLWSEKQYPFRKDLR